MENSYKIVFNTGLNTLHSLRAL